MGRLTNAGERVLRRIATAPPLVILACAWLWLFVYAHPGQMTHDSFEHLIEARTGVYTDGHPPAITLLFKLCDFVIAGPLLMLVIQSTGFLAGLYLVFRRTFAPRGAAWAAAGVFVFPPVMLPMAVIWKDCTMAALLLLGIAALLSERRWARVAGLAAMFAATAVRYNAIAATLPLVVLLFEWRPGLPWLQRYALATAAWLAVTFAAFGVNAALTDKQMHLWHSSLAVYDIVGTLAHVDGELPDAELEAVFAGTELRVHAGIHAAAKGLYSPREFLPIIIGERALWHLPLWGEPAPAAQREAIARAWRELLSSHPGAYLEHRASVFAAVLWLTHPRPGAVPWRGVRVPEISLGLGLSMGWSDVQLEMTAWQKRLSRWTPIFLPFVYAFAALALLPLARQRDVFAILISGLAMEASLFFLAASSDHRYSHWTIACTCVAVVSLTARRARARRGPA